MADGTLKFDTKVDDTGYVQGIKKISSNQLNLQNNIRKTQAEMKRLETAMKEMQNTKVPTQEYLDIQKQITQAESQLNKYLATEERLKATGGVNPKSQSWKNLQYNIEQTRNTLNAAKADMEELKASGGDFAVNIDTTKLEKMKDDYDILTGKLGVYEAKLEEIQVKESVANASQLNTEVSVQQLEKLDEEQTDTSTSTSRLSAMFKKLQSACSTAVNGLRKVGTVAKTVGSAFGFIISNVGKATSAVARGAKTMLVKLNPLNGIKNMFSGMTGRMMLMSLGFTSLSKGLQALSTGFSNIVRTSPQLSSSLAQIKGNLYTAFQPILEACLPALNALFSVLVKVTAALAQFLSMLFGKSVKASQAAAESQYNQAAALDKTASSANKAKKALKGLADFDELHNTSSADNSSPGSGGGAGNTGIKPDFTTDIVESGGVSEFVEALKKAWKESDFTEVGVIIGEKLNSTLESIPWDKIKATSNKIAESIATFINGFMSVKELWTTIGKTIGEGLNTAIGFVNTLVSKLDWEDLGDSLGLAVLSLFDTIKWELLFDTLLTGINGIFSAITSFIATVNDGTLGLDLEPISKSFSNLEAALSPIITKMGDAIGWLYDNVLLPLASWTIDTAIPTTIDLISAALTGISNVIDALVPMGEWLFSNFLEPLAKWTGGIIVSVIEGITTALTKFSDWCASNQSLVEDIAIVIGSFAAAWAVVNIGSIIAGIVTALVGFVATGGLAASVAGALGAAIGLLTSPITLITLAIAGLIAGIVLLIKHWDDVKAAGAKAWEGIKTAWSAVATWFNTTVITPLKDFFSGLWTGIKNTFASTSAWFKSVFTSAYSGVTSSFSNIRNFFNGVRDGIKNSFSGIANWFKTTFTTAWTNVKNVFSKGGKIFNGIKEGILNGLKAVINSLISGINKVIATPFNGLNTALKKVKNVNILGAKPFDFINEISVPKIPALATGTVVPANYGNFLSILGDNKKAPEVVSPIPTMKQAFKEAIMEMGGVGNNGNPIQVEVVIGGKTIMKEVISANSENAKAGKLSFQLA